MQFSSLLVATTQHMVEVEMAIAEHSHTSSVGTDLIQSRLAAS